MRQIKSDFRFGFPVLRPAMITACACQPTAVFMKKAVTASGIVHMKLNNIRRFLHVLAWRYVHKLRDPDIGEMLIYRLAILQR